MDIKLSSPNPTLESVFKNPGQVITLDANFLIPPDRSRYAKKSFDFLVFQRIWLEPIFEAFPNLAIHEAVYDELVLPSVRTYIDTNISNSPPRLTIHKDSSLTAEEYMLRNSIEEKIYPLTKYDPLLDNKDDRGEVKSLAYIAVKGLIYFATHEQSIIHMAYLNYKRNPVIQFEHDGEIMKLEYVGLYTGQSHKIGDTIHVIYFDKYPDIIIVNDTKYWYWFALPIVIIGLTCGYMIIKITLNIY